MKNVIKAITFMGLLLVMLETIIYFMVPNKANYKKYGVYNVATYDILTEDPDTIDVIFLGDSLVYSSISPEVIWNEHGYTSFDCAWPAITIKNAYKYLKIAVDSQHPKVVFMEADVIFRNLKRKKAVLEDFKRNINYLPLSQFHNNWKKILSSDSDKWINSEKGYKYITKKKAMLKDNGNMEITEEKSKIPDGSLDYLDKIIKLCDENNIKFIIISNPSKLSWKYSKTLTVSAIAKERNVEFLDLNKNNPTKIDWKNETKDKGKHINYMGARKVSIFIGNYLKDMNILEDHRKDDKYNNWHVAYDKYHRNHAKYETNAMA